MYTFSIPPSTVLRDPIEISIAEHSIDTHGFRWTWSQPREINHLTLFEVVCGPTRLHLKHTLLESDIQSGSCRICLNVLSFSPRQLNCTLYSDLEMKLEPQLTLTQYHPRMKHFPIRFSQLVRDEPT